MLSNFHMIIRLKVYITHRGKYLMWKLALLIKTRVSELHFLKIYFIINF